MCRVSCAVNPSACQSTKTFCHTEGSDKYCRPCSSASECQTYYINALYQCLTVDSIGVCGVCSPSIACPDRKLCKIFDCVSCSTNSDCPINQPCVGGGCGCLADTDCTDSTKPKCDTSTNTCVGCTAGSQCTRFTSKTQCKISSGSCVECINNSICPANKPICGTGNSCRSCTSNGECNGGICSNGACVQCTQDSHCSGVAGKPKCKLSTNTCAECIYNSHCTQDNLKPYCDGNVCLGCSTNFPCSNPLFCDNTNQICASNDCRSGPCPTRQKIKCQARTYICGSCTSSDDCASLTSFPICYNGQCVACKTSLDCAGDQGCVNGVCVPCSQTSDCTPKLCNTGTTLCYGITCSNNDDCKTYPSSSKCTGGICLPCTQNSDCSLVNFKNFCYQGTCVACETNTDCPGQNVFCHPDTRTCQTKTCNSVTSSVCTSTTPICDMTYYQCKACANNSECKARDSTKPLCKSDGSCVQCMSSDDCLTYPSTKRFCRANGMCEGCQMSTTDCTSVGKYCLGTGACVDCLDNSHCLDPLKKFCKSNQCQACTSADCTALGKQCHSAGNCVDCITNNHCTRAVEKFCKANVCEGCSSHDDCAPAKCDSGTQTCFTAECNPPTKYCSSPQSSKCVDFKCEACTDHPDCSHFAGTPFCVDGECVECLDTLTHCLTPTKPVCNVNNACSSCAGLGDCSRFSLENICSGGQCVECTKSSTCPLASPICKSTKSCGPCSSSSECDSSYKLRPYCSAGQCYECLKDSHCTSVSKAKCSGNVCVPCDDHVHCASFSQPDHIANCYNSQCILCPEKCDLCSSTTFCTSCTSPYVSFDGECGISCVPGWTRKDRVCQEVCGDGVRRDDLCDDGNANDGDGCSSACVIESGWTCSGGGKYTTDICLEKPSLIISQQKDNPNIIMIEFSKTMELPSDLTSLVVLTFKGIDESLYEYEIKQLSDNEIEITVNVSSRIADPKVVISFTDPDLIRDTDNLTINQVEYTANLETIHYEPDSVQALGAMASAAATTAMASSGSILLSGANPALVWALLNLLQIFYYLLFINTEYPINVQKFLEIFALGRLDFLPNPIEIVSPNIEEELLPSPPKFEENEMNSLFLWNAGSMLLIWGIALIGFGIAFLLLKYLRRMPRVMRKTFTKIKGDFQWSGAIRTGMTSYIDLAISAFLQLVYLRFDTIIHIMSSVVALGVTTLVLLFPFIAFRKIRKNEKHPEALLVNHAALVEEFKFTTKYGIYFNLVILVRRGLTAACLVFLQKYVYCQVCGLLALNAVVLVLLLSHKPYNLKRDMILNVVYEAGFFVIHALVLVIVYDNDNLNFSDEVRLTIGWAIISCCLILLGATFVLLMIQQFSLIVYAFRTLKSVYFKGKPPVKQKRVSFFFPTTAGRIPKEILKGKSYIHNKGNNQVNKQNNFLEGLDPRTRYEHTLREYFKRQATDIMHGKT